MARTGGRRRRLWAAYGPGHANVDYKRVSNKSAKNWDLGYELVVSFMYGLDEDVISKIAGLRNFDSGTTMSGPEEGIRDLMFPCGTSLELAQKAGQRLRGADHFGALRLRISCPVEHEGKNDFTPWYDIDGRLIERVKHRKLAVIVQRSPARKRKKVV